MSENNEIVPSRLLSYPEYAPETSELRRLLLFYDSITTIVPIEDRGRVQGITGIRELLELGGQPIDFLDPSDHIGWVGEGVEDVIANILATTGDVDPEVERRIDRIRGGAGEPSGLDLSEEDANFFASAKWVPVSEQRIHPKLIDGLKRKYLAFEVNNWTHVSAAGRTTRPLMLHSTVANFVRARLARHAAEMHNLPAHSSIGESIADYLLDPSSRPSDRRATLLSIGLPVMIPDKLENLGAREFLTIRNEYEDVRRRMKPVVSELSRQYDLDNYDDTQKIMQGIETVRNAFKSEMARAEKSIGLKRFEEERTVSFEFFASILSSVPVVGGLLGFGVQQLGRIFSENYSTFKHGSPEFERLVSLRTRINTSLNSEGFEVPYYHRNVRHGA